MKNGISTVLAAIALTAMPLVSSATVVKGRVTAEGKPLAGVSVSDGRTIVKTDTRGRYVLPTDKADSIVFITTPSGYVAEPLDAVRPGFWQLLTAPAGKNERHDFKLIPEDQNAYSVILISDCHLAGDPSRKDFERFTSTIVPLAKSLADEAGKKGPVYSFNLGDFSHDRYWFEFGVRESEAEQFLAESGYPVKTYTVSGNHDNDASFRTEVNNDFASAWNYRHTWGPDRYSVNIGGDHWIVLDNVIYLNEGEPKKTHKNIVGSRNYRCRFTEEELDWLRKDLADVDPSTRVFMCNHVPVFNDAYSHERIETDQLPILDEIFSKFSRVTLLAGHTHKMLTSTTGEYTRFVQYIMPATSGNMWQNPEGTPTIGSDASDNGLTLLDCSVETPDPYYVTAAHGHKLMRVYDMNAVGEYYATNDGCSIMRKLYPNHADYSDPQYRNMIYVNYWGLRPGDVIEVIENGKPLDVRKIAAEDPLHVITYVASSLTLKSKYKAGDARIYANAHLFAAKASTPTAPVIVRVTNAAGKVVCEETVVRPKKFGYDAE